MPGRWSWVKTWSRAAPHLLGARPTVFLYNIAALVGLGVLAIYYFSDSSIHGLLPDRLQGVPVYGVWYGALGGIAVGLKGCYDHRLDWTDDWSVWHYGRVFSGALAGGVTYALLLAVNLKSGNAVQTPATPIVASASFILGTQEKRFFEFLVEVGKLIVTVPASATGPTAPPPAIRSVVPATGAAGRRVIVHGTGFQRTSKAYFGGVALGDISVNDAGTEISGTAPDHAPGEVDVVVSNPDNSAHLRPSGFTYEALTRAEQTDDVF